VIVEVEVLTAKTVALTWRDPANRWSTTMALTSAQTAELAESLTKAVETQRRLWPEATP